MKGERYGDFILDAPLGEGGMGTVWRARHLRSATVAALKIVHADVDDDPTALAAFDAEVGAVARCMHPNIVRVFDFGVRDGEPWLAMELVSGGDLGSRRPTSWKELRVLLRHILSALAHAHAHGIVHRDLKPGNVLRGDVAKVTDFGLAHRSGRGGTKEQVHVAAGTPLFMAPEQIRGQWRDFGPWTDLYALGCVAWDLTTGQPPFVATNIVDIAAMHLFNPVPALQPHFPVPDGFERWVHELLVKDPRKRLASAAEVASLLDELDDAPSAITALREPISGDAETLPLPTVVDTLVGELSRGQGYGAAQTDAPRSAPTQIPEFAPAPLERPWGLERESLRLFSLRPVPLTGREAEVARLWEVLRDVADRGEARVVLIRGPDGCGKSRLARWLGEAAHEYAGCRMFRATHHSPAHETDGLRGMVARAMRLERLSRDDARARLAELTEGNNCPELFRPAAAFLRLVDDEAFSASTHFLTLRQLLAVATRGHPCILVLDSIHLDPTTCAFVESVVRESDAVQAPLLVLATLDEQDSGGSVARMLERTEFEVMNLRPLPIDTLTRIVRDELRIDPDLAAEIASLADGFTMYAMQAVGQMIRNGQLVAGERGLERAEQTVEPVYPRTANELWRQHVKSLLEDDDALLIVGTGAVLGAEVEDFAVFPAMAALGVKGGDSEVVRRLVLAGLVERSEGRWILRYAPFRHAVIAALRHRGLYERVQRAVADVLAGRASTPTECARVAHHQLEGGRPADATEAACLAIAAAVRSDGRENAALHDALEVAARASAMLGGLPPELDRVVRIGHATECQNLGHTADALQWLDGMPHRGDDLDVYATLVRVIVLQLQAEIPEARVVAEEALAAGVADPLMRVRLLRALARLCQRLGALDAAEQHVRAALGLLGDGQDSIATGWCHYRLAQIARARGDIEASSASNDRARHFFDSADFAIGLGETLNLRGELLRDQGRLLEAMEVYGRAYDELLRAGASWAEVPRLNRAIAAVFAGQAASLHIEVEDIRDRLHGRSFELLHVVAALLACAVAADRGAAHEFDTLTEELSGRLAPLARDDDVCALAEWTADRWRAGGDADRAAVLLRELSP